MLTELVTATLSDLATSTGKSNLKIEPLFYKFTSFTVDANYNSITATGNTASSSGIYNPIAFTASGSNFYDPKEIYDARERWNYTTSTLEEVNPNATYKLTAPEEGLYIIKCVVGDDTSSGSGGNPSKINTSIRFDNTNNPTNDAGLRPDGTDHIHFGEQGWNHEHPYRTYQINMSAGQVFWVSAWSVGSTDAFMQFEIQIDLIKVVV